MSEQQFRLTVRLKLQTDLHIAGPGRTLPLVDRTVEVNSKGIPFIPASSLRGRLRAQVERLLKAFGQKVCSAPRPERMCPHAGLPDFCTACRIFGSPWRLSAVTFTDWFPPSKQQEAFVNEEQVFSTRTGIGINRRLNTVEEKRLFVTETVPEKVAQEELTFEGQIEGWLERKDIGWLLAGLQTLMHLGGGKARGLGRVEVVTINLEFYDEATGNWERQDWQAVLKEAISDGAG